MFKNELSKINERQNEIAVARVKLRDESDTLKAEKRAVAAEFIGKAFNGFLADMQNQWLKRDYIEGRYSSNFTRHVNRAFSWFRNRGFTTKHQDAIRDYNMALCNLNRVFVEEILANPDEAKRMLMEYAGVKDIKNIR